MTGGGNFATSGMVITISGSKPTGGLSGRAGRRRVGLC